MKITIYAAASALLLAGCSKPERAKIHVTQSLQGIEISHVHDTLITQDGQYHVYANVTNHRPTSINYVQVDATCKDEQGKTLAKAMGNPNGKLQPGATGTVDLTCTIPQQKNVLKSVEVNAEEL